MSGIIGTINQVGALARSVGRLASDVSALATGAYLSPGFLSGLGPWADGMLPASWRGVPFAVRNSSVRRGRKVAVHEYPFRDDVWVEDLGRGTRVVSFAAFLVGDDVFFQRDAMLAAAEEPGPGLLVHPSLGTLVASLTEFSAAERADLGRVVEIDFSFIQTAEAALYPSTAASTAFAALDAADQADAASGAGFGAGVADSLLVGADAVGAATASVQGWVNVAGALVNDGARIVGSLRGIGAVVGGGAYFGRYADGGLATPPVLAIDRTLSLTQRTTAAVAGLTAASVNAASAVTAAGATAVVLAGGL